jgi:hypothetical protein
LLLDGGGLNPDRQVCYLNVAFLPVLIMGVLVDSVHSVLARNGGDTVLNLRQDGTATAADFLDVARVAAEASR